MKRTWLIVLLLVVVAAVVAFFLLRRRTSTVTAEVRGGTATTPQPAGSLAALFTGTAGQLLNPLVAQGVQQVTRFLPTIGSGTSAYLPQQGSTPSPLPSVYIDPLHKGALSFFKSTVLR